MRLRGAGLALLALWAASARADEVIPPSPPAYFNDYAGLVRPETARSLNTELDQFERSTSNQIVVAIYPTMQSDSSIEDYTVRVAQSWHSGQKGKDNGAVLFIFSESHKMYLQVGYGLEGAIPDATAKRIISNEITPAFRAGDYDAGMTAGVHAILAATRGEYKGTGGTAAGRKGQMPPLVFLAFFAAIFGLVIVLRAKSLMYSGVGRSRFGGGFPIIFSGGGGGFGGGGGGGGGFSGGGGSFGGGGAGGSW